ncbi:MAG: hypothetical protein ABIA47_01465 [bacterium]
MSEKIDIPTTVKKPQKLDDIIIHSMPREFLGRDADLKAAPKERSVALPLPPPPQKTPPVKKPASPRAPSRAPLVVAAVGIILIGVLAIASVFALRGISTIEEPVEDEVVIEEEPIEEEEEEVVVIPGLDIDSDGLSNIEERLYGTDYRNPDTDGDTYLDGNEVFHRYDPLGLAPSTLLDTGSVKIAEALDGEDVLYSVYYPASWALGEDLSIHGGAPGLEFSAGSGEHIRIKRHMRIDGQEFKDWYDETIAPNNGAEDLAEITSKVGYTGYMSTDELKAYLELDDWFFEFIYDLNGEETIEYLQTFLMMLNSFEYAG